MFDELPEIIEINKNDIIEVEHDPFMRYPIMKCIFRCSNNSKKILPKHYIINNGATILFWDDGTKTIVKRAEDDIFDPVKSFLWAYFQKHSGLSKTKANKYLRKLDKEHEPVITIKGNIDPGFVTFTGVFTEEK